MSMEFNFELTQDDSGRWTARIVEVPEAEGHGDTQQEALCAAACRLNEAIYNPN